jgi:hypothetical protein
MAFVKNQNSSVKAFRSFLCKENKTEYGIAFQDNPQRKGYTTGDELRNKFFRKDRWDVSNNHGASKHSYLLDYIVIKRQLIHGMNDCGNQLELEIKFYLEHKNDKYSDVICPILRYGLHRGDRVESTSEKYYNQTYIVAQKAVYVSDSKSCCREAERLNIQNNFKGENASERYEKLKDFAQNFHMWDVLRNSGNCGVIFDYDKNCYKAVCIDYAL